MAPPKGNKFGVGHGIGRDKKYDREEYAVKILEWAKKPTSLGIAGFCAENDLPLEYMSRWSKESDAFRQALMITRAKLADRQEHYLNMGRYDHRLFLRQIGYYNAAIRDFDHEELEFEYGLKKDLEQNKEMSAKIEIVDYRKKKDV
jgi:hypothetical protein